MMGNIRASSLEMMDNNTLFGSIKTENGIKVGENNTIHGDLVTRGDVRVYRGTHILGEINGGKIYIHEEARVDGAMRAPGGVIISRDLMEEEGFGGILDIVPTAKPAEGTAKTSSVKRSAANPEVKKTAKKSEATAAAGISDKRMITAVRVPELTKSVEVAKKPAVKKTTAKKKTPAKKSTGTKKKTKAKTTAKKKSTTKKTSVKKSTK
ncbi:MAG: hypothetical protein E4H33_00820 [Anaerolineales bacterium]|nr:MAG: hypothetical protein E4H33_00820 [Anaerolineales bacterium]